MTFAWPTMLWFLLCAPLFVILYWQLDRRRRQQAARFSSLGLVQAAQNTRGAGVRRHIPAFFILAGLVVLLFSLARPQMEVKLPRIEGIVILAFDTSGSMAADDLTPTRMEVARQVAQEFVERQPVSVQIGVVAFSDSGFSVQQPTNDADAIRTALDRLSPQRSTSLANGISIALDTIAKFTGLAPEYNDDFPTDMLPEITPVPEGTYSPAVIVLISDGENTTNNDPFGAAQIAANLGVRIHTIGIGSPEGADLEVDGFMIHTQLDEPVLRQIAEMTDGKYFNAASEEELREIYEQIEPQLIVRSEKTEITALLAGASILLLLAGGFLSLLWFNRIP